MRTAQDSTTPQIVAPKGEELTLIRKSLIEARTDPLFRISFVPLLLGSVESEGKREGDRVLQLQL
jgi:hypothetical protein